MTNTMTPWINFDGYSYGSPLHALHGSVLGDVRLAFCRQVEAISSSSVARRHAALHTSTCPTAPTLTAEEMEAALGGVSDDELEMDEDEMRRGAT